MVGSADHISSLFARLHEGEHTVAGASLVLPYGWGADSVLAKLQADHFQFARCDREGDGVP